jgi:hypothetical protein
MTGESMENNATPPSAVDEAPPANMTENNANMTGESTQNNATSTGMPENATSTGMPENATSTGMPENATSTGGPTSSNNTGNPSLWRSTTPSESMENNTTSPATENNAKMTGEPTAKHLGSHLSLYTACLEYPCGQVRQTPGYNFPCARYELAGMLAVPSATPPNYETPIAGATLAIIGIPHQPFLKTTTAHAPSIYPGLGLINYSVVVCLGPGKHLIEVRYAGDAPSPPNPPSEPAYKAKGICAWSYDHMACK